MLSLALSDDLRVELLRLSPPIRSNCRYRIKAGDLVEGGKARNPTKFRPALAEIGCTSILISASRALSTYPPADCLMPLTLNQDAMAAMQAAMAIRLRRR